MSVLPVAAVLGALAGLMLGLTGAGGGVLALPMLVLGLGLSIPAAAPVALLAVGLASALGAALGLRQGIVRYRAAGYIAGCGMLTAPVGLWLGHQMHPLPLALCFATAQSVVSVRLWRGANCTAPAAKARCPCRLDPGTQRVRWTRPCAQALAATGAFAGALSGLLGVGGGFVIVPALRYFTDLPMNSIVATSLAVIAAVSLATAGATLAGGWVSMAVAAPFVIGAGAGLLLGRWLAPHIGGLRLQKLFAVVGLLAAAALLAQGHITGLGSR